MTYKGSDYYTALAYTRAHNIGFDLNPELGKSLIEKIRIGDVFWEGPPEHNGAIPVQINLFNRRLRLIVDDTKTKIITLAERDFASRNAVKQAERLGFVLNLAMTTLLMEKIKARDSDIIETAQCVGRTIEAKMNFDKKGIRVVFSEDSGCIIQIDDYAGPRVNSQHPAVTRHAAERAVQRYETELTPKLTDEIVRRIVTNTDLIDHYKIKSGAMAAIVELSEGKPACIIYAPSPGMAVPIRIITVTPMTYHEAHGRKFVEQREAAHMQAREAKRERFMERKKNQKRQKTLFHRASRDDDDDLERAYG